MFHILIEFLMFIIINHTLYLSILTIFFIYPFFLSVCSNNNNVMFGLIFKDYIFCCRSVYNIVLFQVGITI